MRIPTEPIGSIPTPHDLLEAIATGDGTDPGLAPLCDNRSTTRDTAFAKIRARAAGTAMASAILGGG
ncbi:MAG: hypothetical protein ACLQGP_11940 [Isosphaeraceae bacterium]